MLSAEYIARLEESVQKAIEILSDALSYKNMTCGESKPFITKAIEILRGCQGVENTQPSYKGDASGPTLSEILKEQK